MDVFERMGKEETVPAVTVVMTVHNGARFLRQAIDSAYEGVRCIRFDGMQFRTDIGAKGLLRWS